MAVSDFVVRGVILVSLLARFPLLLDTRTGSFCSQILTTLALDTDKFTGIYSIRSGDLKKCFTMPLGMVRREILTQIFVQTKRKIKLPRNIYGFIRTNPFFDLHQNIYWVIIFSIVQRYHARYLGLSPLSTSLHLVPNFSSLMRGPLCTTSFKIICPEPSFQLGRG